MCETKTGPMRCYIAICGSYDYPIMGLGTTAVQARAALLKHCPQFAGAVKSERCQQVTISRGWEAGSGPRLKVIFCPSGPDMLSGHDDSGN